MAPSFDAAFSMEKVQAAKLLTDNSHLENTSKLIFTLARSMQFASCVT
jgi:hypothetical protein